MNTSAFIDTFDFLFFRFFFVNADAKTCFYALPLEKVYILAK